MDKLHTLVSAFKDSRIVLLRQKEVLQWIYGDLSFLTPINVEGHDKFTKKKEVMDKKISEDKWGQTMLKLRRPDLKLDKQWTNKFGEHLCEEVLILYGKEVYKPKIINHYHPDIETNDKIWEVKTGTYHTHGTAGEKILGCPFKYAEVPELYSKPLAILCIGGSEYICRNQYGNLNGPKWTNKKQLYIEFFKDNQIEFVGMTDLLNKWVDLESITLSSLNLDS